MALDPATVQAWVNVGMAAEPLIQSGIVAAQAIVQLFRTAHPEATDGEVNAILGTVAAQADRELAALAAEGGTR